MIIVPVLVASTAAVGELAAAVRAGVVEPRHH